VPEGLLTEAELELMRHLWSAGPLTAREVMGRLPDDRAYTTVATILRILVDKGFATAARDGRAYRFAPAVGRSEYQLRQLRHVVSGLFDGSPVSLVRQLVAHEDLSDDDVAALKELVEELDE